MRRTPPETPAFGETGPLRQPYYTRSPSRSFHDLTVFKNFPLGRGSRRLQARVGVFNIFNQAYANRDDIDVGLNTTCNRPVDGVPDGTGGTANDVCDPTGGFSFTPPLENFGRIITKRGHRVVEFALKLYF